MQLIVDWYPKYSKMLTNVDSIMVRYTVRYAYGIYFSQSSSAFLNCLYIWLWLCTVTYLRLCY